MKISTSKKIMALAASALLLCATGADAKAKKPSGGSVTGDIVISKVFYSGSIRLNGATPKNYMFHQYVELYNNSADTLDVSGLYLAFPNSDSAINAWTAEEMQTAHKDSIVVKQIFQIPAEPTCLLDPGKSLVITNCAVDHSKIAVGNVNLSSADFEVKSTNKSYVELHNDAVPALSLIYSPTAALDFMNILNPGPSGVILLAADTKIDDCPLTYAKGKTTGNQYKIVPAFKTIDCVDIVKQKEPSAADKRIPTSYDAGFCVTDSIGTFSGQAVMRKTAYITSDGRTVLFDTNNSSIDFMSTNDLSLRTYCDTISGLSDSTIVIPESGYLAIKPSKPFCGNNDVLFCYVNATAKSTDFKYNEIPGDSLLLMAGDWIAIGKPGSHDIKLSEAQACMRTRSTSQQWSEENHKELTGGQKTRSIYKFSNAVGKVGFQRVPQTSDGGYNVADFSDGDRLYVTLTPAIIENFKETFGVADLDFIPWTGSTPESIETGIQTTAVAKSVRQHAIYNLNGQQLSTLQKGINIIDGKKVFVK